MLPKAYATPVLKTLCNVRPQIVPQNKRRDPQMFLRLILEPPFPPNHSFHPLMLMAKAARLEESASFEACIMCRIINEFHRILCRRHRTY